MSIILLFVIIILVWALSDAVNEIEYLQQKNDMLRHEMIKLKEGCDEM